MTTVRLVSGALLIGLVLAGGAAHAATTCGNGRLEGGEQCDPGGALTLQGEPGGVPCTSGTDCFFETTCCKFNCQYVGQGAPCSDGNDCTAGEVCGNVGQCLQGDPVPDGTSCSDGLYCDGADTCAGGECAAHAGNPCAVTECVTGCDEAADACAVTPGAACASDGNPCTSDVCDVAGACTHPAAPAGTPCRASAGACDVAEACDGVATACPVDAFRPATAVCRTAAGVCDRVETCTGAGPVCPSDARGTGLCRAPAGPCDVAESCDGVGVDCPADAFAGTAVVCRPAVAECDAAESCDGTGVACPPDAKSTAECRGVADACDLAERCDGVGDACPADAVAPAGTPCRDAIGTCDVTELCTGLSSACPADVRVEDGTPCGENCTVGGLCEAGLCTATAPAPDGTPCEDGLDCTVVDVCRSGACESGPDFFATDWLALGGLSTVGGDVTVNAPDGYVRLGRDTVMEDGTRATAALVRLGFAASVYDAATDAVVGRGFVRGFVRGQVFPATFPVVGAGCVMPPTACGGPDVVVAADQVRTITPGAYGSIRVLQTGTLQLTAGAYDVCELRGSSPAVVLTLGPVTVRVAEGLKMGRNARIAPAEGVARPVFWVGGPATFGASSHLDAHVRAPSQTFKVGRESDVGGSVCALRVKGGRTTVMACVE